MSKERQKNQREIDQGIEDFNKNRSNRKSGINKQEWEKIKSVISLTPKQHELYTGIRNNTLTICQGPAGTAKAQPLDSPILTPDGWVKMGDLEVGDRVISADGNPTIITGTFPQGKIDIWELTFSDGTKVECCSDHLWLTITEKDRNNRKWTKKVNGVRTRYRNPLGGSVKTTKEIVETLYTKRNRLNHTIPITKPVNFKEIETEIDPYLFGILLGDGCFRGKVSLTSADIEIIENISNILDEDEMYLSYQGRYDYNIVKADRKSKIRNKYIEFIKKIGLFNLKSDEKYIPNIYKFNSVENRIKLLNGIMDADGCVSKSNVTFSSTSKRLIDDVKELVQSLGGICTDHSPYYPTYTYNGEKRKGKISYRITLTMPPDINPFSLKRKMERVIPKSKYKPTRYITSARIIGKKDAKCIMVDNPSRLYLTNNYIVTHNTFVACYSAIGLLADRKIERIILTKPIQESGENLGFLPGTIEEKTDPYMQSYFSTFQKIVGKQSFEFMKSIGEIVVEPIAYMRGTTYDDSIMLLDEAQNCNMHQLMLWSTRLGRNSKAVMMGDISQYDIKKKDSKFLDFISLVTGEYEFKEDGMESQQNYKKILSDVYSHKFGVEDIVRNKFLIDLVDRYEKYKFQNGL